MSEPQTPLSTETNAPRTGPIQVMVVDDSVVIRGFLTKFLEEDSDLEVVSSVANGEMALGSLERRPVDVVVLDIEMPVMDGLTALPKLFEIDPFVKVIMASTLTKKNAAITLEALQLGAAECLAKPSTTQELSGTEDFKRDLVTKTKELGYASRQARTRGVGAAPSSTTPAAGSNTETADIQRQTFALRAEGFTGAPKAVVIGSSTGGPQALLRVFEDLKDGLKQPIFITQHMPATFTTILAEHIAKHSGLECAEGVDGEEVQPGRVYLAPGGKHMVVEDRGGKICVALNEDPPESFCRPAVDPMLRSIQSVYGDRILVTILTGMGADGEKACQALADSGGGIIVAQDEQSSIVWGMPGAVTNAGISSWVLPLDEIGRKVKEIAGRA